MPSRNAIVGSAVGLHARPAALVAQAAGEYDADITLRLSGDDPDDGVDAASSLMIMTLGAGKGAEVTIDSEDAAAVDRIAELIEQDLDA